MRLPEAIFLQTVTGDYPEDPERDESVDIDIVLRADPKTVRVVPWAAEPTAQVIHDCYYGDGRPSPWRRATCAPGARVVRGARLGTGGGAGARVLSGGANIDSDYPLKPPVGRSGDPKPVARPTVLPPSTSSIRCSMTCIRSVMRRIWRSIP